METSPPTMTFWRDLIRSRLASWNEQLQRLTSVHLMHGSDEFRWGLTKKGVFSISSMYKALIEPVQPILNNKFIWKMKIPLKTKVFSWFLHRGVILTKYNIVKCNCHGCTKCIFYHKEERIKHLIFPCRFARSIWSIIHIGSTLYHPQSVKNIFVKWLNGVDSRFKTLIRVGVIIVVWSLWLCRNNKVFNSKSSSLMQVIYRCTALRRLWSSLQRLEDHELFKEVSTQLENTTKNFISQHGWLHNHRIAAIMN
jgi:hypothetical protein